MGYIDQSEQNLVWLFALGQMEHGLGSLMVLKQQVHNHQEHLEVSLPVHDQMIRQ